MVENLTSASATLWPHIYYIIGLAYYVEVVLYDDDGIALVYKLLEYLHQEGPFCHAYEQSAWLYTRFAAVALNPTRHKSKKFPDGSYVMVGHPPTSIEKFQPKDRLSNHTLLIKPLLLTFFLNNLAERKKVRNFAIGILNVLSIMSTTIQYAPQTEIINMMSFVKSPDTFTLLKQVISDFFAKEADKALNAMWDKGELDDEKIEGFRYLHERTPYK